MRTTLSLDDDLNWEVEAVVAERGQRLVDVPQPAIEWPALPLSPLGG